MRASRGVNLWLTQRAIALGFVCGREMPCGIATRHKGRAEAYFLLEFLFLLFQDKRNTIEKNRCKRECRFLFCHQHKFQFFV